MKQSQEEIEGLLDIGEHKWVGLNGKELGKAYESDQNTLPTVVSWPLFLEVYRYIESLLKEKNS